MDSISLLAQSAYTKVNNQPTPQALDTVKEAVNFQDMVNIEFNRFAAMSPDQILSHINNVKSGNVPSSGITASVVGELRQKIGNHDNMVKKALINEASLLDIVTATNEANKTVRLMTTVRDKFFDAFNNIMNMSI